MGMNQLALLRLPGCQFTADLRLVGFYTTPALLAIGQGVQSGISVRLVLQFPTWVDEAE